MASSDSISKDCSTQTYLIGPVYEKDGFAIMPIYHFMDMFDSLFRIESTRTVAIDAKYDQDFGEINQILIGLLDQIEYIETKNSKVANRKEESSESLTSLPSLQILFKQLNITLEAMQNASSDLLNTVSQRGHPMKYWLWRVERAITYLKFRIETEEHK